MVLHAHREENRRNHDFFTQCLVPFMGYYIPSLDTKFYVEYKIFKQNRPKNIQYGNSVKLVNTCKFSNMAWKTYLKSDKTRYNNFHFP